jgi:hypothetical protein
MAPNRTSFQRPFNTNLLEPDALGAPDGLKTALSSIESVCHRDDTSIMEMVVGLSSRPHILEYIFSSTLCMPVVLAGMIKRTDPVVLDGQAYEGLSKWIISQFPTSATPSAMETIGVKLLQRLASSLMIVEGVSTAEHRNKLRKFGGGVGPSLGVLEELSRCADQFSIGAIGSPVGRKRPKAPARRIKLDPHPFDCAGIAVPMTDVEARALCDDILSQLHSVLRVRVSLPPRLVLSH